MKLTFEDGHAVDLRRLAALGFVGLLLVSGVGGMLVGSSTIAAAQQGGAGNNTTANDAPWDTLRGGQDAIQGGQLANPYTGLAAANGNYSDEDAIQGGALADPCTGLAAANGSGG
jgi:hypothetical protein